jgi:ubiquinol-cytochrome c reductase cytochrome b subunit
MRRLIRAWKWFDDRIGYSKIVDPLARHQVPPKVGWYYVFGSATLACFLMQVFTGSVLATTYVSSASGAYDSLKYITHDSLFGSFMRGLHYFGASAMILLIGIHALRVFLTGSFKFPREMNWLTGGALLLLTVTMGFTGQLLRYDQNGMWSAVIAAEQAGRVPWIGPWLASFILAGDTLGAATLSRFFAAHVFFIPGLIFLFVGVHLYLVILNGISEPPVAGRPVDPKAYRSWYEGLLKREGEPFWPNAAWRDVVFVLLVVLVIVGLAATVGAPELGRPPDPTIIQAEPRPDWYLLWYFALLALIPPWSERWVIFLAPLGFILVLFFLPLLFNSGERSPRRRPWAIVIVATIVVMVGTLWIEGKRSPWSPDFTAKPLPASVVGTITGPVARGADLFYKKGCEFCHTIAGHGGNRGPNLTTVADRMTPNQMTIRILNGATNMPAFGGYLKPGELDAIVTFLGTRKAPSGEVPQPTAH